MAKLLEQYNMVCSELKRISDAVAKVRADIKALDEHQKIEIPARIENIKAQLSRIDDAVIKIESYKRVAKKYLTSLNLPTIEVSDGYKVNLNKLKYWSEKLGTMSAAGSALLDNPYALRLYEVSCCDLLFLQKKRGEFEKKLAELECALSEDDGSTIAELNVKADMLEAEMLSYLNSEEFKNFAEEVVNTNNASCYLEPPTQHTDQHKDYNNWTVGLYGCPLFLVEKAKAKAIKALQQYYNPESGNVMLPIERLDISGEFGMLVSCVSPSRRVAEMDAGIRNLALNFIDKTSVGSRKIYIIDAARMNATIAGSLAPLEGSIAMANIPQNKEQIQTALEEIVSSFVEIDDIIVNYDSVAEYNETVDANRQLPRSLVIFVGGTNTFSGELEELVKCITTKHERYGISYILANIAAKVEVPGFVDQSSKKLIKIAMGERGNVIKFGEEAPLQFEWTQFKLDLSQEYCAGIRGYSVNMKEKGCEYSNRIDITAAPAYKRAYKPLLVPYGINSKEELQYISFENRNYATYIAGRQGAGKSSLLNIIITGIIRNYHPDNVELWLADFTGTGFVDYINHMPPHVKYLLLEDASEPIFDFIDRLSETVNERQQLLSTQKVKKYENLDVKKLLEPLPVIMVMVDGFASVSRAISKSQNYKNRLKNILAKSENLGIKFIFSGNDFTSEFGGLFDNARALLPQRIALKSSKADIEKTLDLGSDLNIARIKLWIEALPLHYALIKQNSESDGKVELKRSRILCFTESYVREEIIDRVSDSMKSSVDYKATDIRYYVGKNTVCIDGKTFEKFSEDSIVSGIKEEALHNERYKGDETFVSFGNPRRMCRMKPIPVVAEDKQNILLFANASNINASASVVASSLKCFKLQKKKAEIWSCGWNPLFKVLKDNGFCDADTKTEVTEIAQGLDELDKVLEADKKEKDRIIVLMGISDIVAQLKAMDEDTSSKQDEGGELSELIEEDKSINALEDLEKEVKNQLISHTDSAENSAPRLLNAEKLIELLDKGGNYGIHFLLVVERLEELTDSGLSLEMFKHRLTFAATEEVSGKVLGSDFAVNLPENILAYSNMTSSFSLRPYVCEGLAFYE